ncbi:hypothetical protein [Pseudomonas sp. NPDC089534]|uniref:hypothetical protein n=1 Tax=Pseudomonas sp. NPDC089534 TaxID=3364468 RepID=UPI0038043ADE
MKCFKPLIVCLVGVGLVGCGSSKPEKGVVAENWSTNTEQLGIKAIYPPRAQFEVGDVFIARAVKAGHKIKTADYVLGSVRIDHIDLSEELYQSAPTVMFESTDTYEDGSGTSVQTRKVLPLKVRERVINSQVAFPGFTFASLAESDVGVNVTSSAIGALLGFGRRSQYSVSYSVPAAETYGVTYLLAKRRFESLAPTRYSLTDHRMMREAAEDLQATQSRFSDGSAPVLVLVTDVYLTRAIDVIVSSEEGMSASFSALTLAMVDLSDKKKALEAQLIKLRRPPEGSTPPAPAGGGDGAGKVQTKEDAVTKAKDPAKPDQPEPEPEPKAKVAAAPAVPADRQAEIDKVEDELVQVNAQLRQQVNKVAPDLPGVTGSVVKSSALGLTLRQAFARPVAIGYRGIHYSVGSLQDSQTVADASGGFKPAPGTNAVPLFKKMEVRPFPFPFLEELISPATKP